MSRRGAYAMILTIIAAVGLAVFFWGHGGAVRASTDGLYVIYLAMAGILVGAGLLSRGAGRIGGMVRDFLIWSGIIAAFAVGFTQWQEHQIKSAPGGAYESAEPISAPVPQDSGGSVTIRKSDDGHFWTDARVNGRSQRFMIDTGASYVALPLSDAKRLGVTPRREDYVATVQTANGPAKAAPVVLRDIRISGVMLHDVDAVVLDHGLDTALLGMSFMGRLQSFEAKADTLRLRR
jgi:aspartyl protease family protein